LSACGRLRIFNVFRYLTFRTGGAVMTALLICFSDRAVLHSLAQAAPGQGPADPHRRPAAPCRGEARHADDGGLLILIRIVLATLLWADLSNLLRLGRAAGDAQFGLLG
jgi:phospho-N-acetylmuramoyl-pentapeptide-transferase